jgi:hypothetical protein
MDKTIQYLLIFAGLLALAFLLIVTAAEGKNVILLCWLSVPAIVGALIALVKAADHSKDV